MFLIGWGNTTWDADASLFPTLRSGNPFANYFSPEFDLLVDEAQVTADNTRRRALYARAQRLVLDDAAVIPLYQQVDLYGVNKRLRFQALSRATGRCLDEPSRPSLRPAPDLREWYSLR